MTDLTESVRQTFLEAPFSLLVDEIVKANTLDPDRVVVCIAKSGFSIEMASSLATAIEDDSFEFEDSISLILEKLEPYLDFCHNYIHLAGGHEYASEFFLYHVPGVALFSLALVGGDELALIGHSLDTASLEDANRWLLAEQQRLIGLVGDEEHHDDDSD